MKMENIVSLSENDVLKFLYFAGMGRTHQRRNCQLDGCKQGDDAKQRPIPSAAAQDRVGPRHARGVVENGLVSGTLF